MAFVRNRKKTVDIPHEPGNSVSICFPERHKLAEAAKVRQIEAVGRMRDLGGAAFLNEVRAAAGKDTAEADKATPNPADAFDQDLLLAAGVESWSGPEYDGQEVNAANLANLDPTTARYLAEEIASFATGQEIVRKNASPSSAA